MEPLAPTLKTLKYDMINCVIPLKSNINTFLIAHVLKCKKNTYIRWLHFYKKTTYGINVITFYK